MHILLRIVAGTVLLAALVLTTGGCGGGSDTAGGATAQDSRIFDMLDQYGVWVDIHAYGTVWRPNVSPDWRPYTYGNWIWSDEGWVWLGYEPFAWVVYHYGSWYNDRGYGWVWVPAYDWAPAPVAWASTDDYVAWAPLPPQGTYLMQPGDPYWDQMWVVVPVDRFRQEDVGKFNIAKDTVSGGRVRGGTRKPPDVKRLPAARVDSLRVDFDKVPAGGRDLLRLKLPSYEEQVIDARTEEFRRDVMRSGGQPAAAPVQHRDRTVEPTARVPKSAGTARDQTPPVSAPPRQHEKVDEPVAKPAGTTRGQTPAVNAPGSQHQKVDEPVTKPATPVREPEKAKTEGADKKPAPAAKPTPPLTPPEKKDPESKDKPN